MIESIIFYFLSAVIVASSIFVVRSKNVFHSALWLVAALMGVAGIYAMLAADFLFAVQLMVYAGGIMVILLFVILLSNTPKDWEGSQFNEKSWAAGLFGLFLIAVVVTNLHNWSFTDKVVPPEATTGKLGELLLNDMVLPFEVVALVLVVALVGAIYFSSRKSS